MKVSQLVEDALKRWPQTRDSDKKLILAVWSEQGLRLTPEQKKLFYQVASPESITRCRRKLQEQGKYPASKSVEEQRFKKFKEYKDNFGQQYAKSMFNKFYEANEAELLNQKDS